MSAPLTLTQIVAFSKIHALQTAIVKTLETLFPDINVKSHPGKLDIEDIVAKDVFNAPALAIAIIRQTEHGRLSASRDVTVSVSIFVIVEDMAIGEPPLAVYKDELGHGICDALTCLLNGRDSSRWGYQDSDIAFPADVKAMPIFTIASADRAAAIYAVTFEQTLHNLDLPWDAEPDAGLHLAPPPPFTVLYDPPLLGAAPVLGAMP